MAARPDAGANHPVVTLVLPCLNEADSVGLCVRAAIDVFQRAGLAGEVVVVDNGSTDGSDEIAAAEGGRVVHEPGRGYGRALRSGILAARGSIVVMADADFTYDFEKIPMLIDPVLRGEADLVLGSRLDGATRETMPWLHRHVGTPLLTFLIRRACGATGVRDSQSGFRAFRRDRIIALGLQSDGMEFASEMLIRAVRADLRIREVSAGYRERIGASKLRRFSDGWRHLQLIFMLAPHILLVGPGAVLLIAGLAFSFTSLITPAGLTVGSLRWQPVYFSTIALVVGTQAFLFGAVLAHESPVVAKKLRDRFRFVAHPLFTTACILAGVLAVLLGLVVDLVLFLIWVSGRAALTYGLAAASFGQSLLIVGTFLVGFGFLRRLSLRRSIRVPLAIEREAESAAQPVPVELDETPAL